jgi:hypothetical protein
MWRHGRLPHDHETGALQVPHQVLRRDPRHQLRAMPNRPSSIKAQGVCERVGNLVRVRGTKARLIGHAPFERANI